MNENRVAYLITYISYSCIFNIKGTIEEHKLKDFLLTDLSEYIINNSSIKFNTVNDVENFWKKYDDFNVWSASYVKNNDCITATLSNEEIFIKIRELSFSLESIDLEMNKNDYDDDCDRDYNCDCDCDYNCDCESGCDCDLKKENQLFDLNTLVDSSEEYVDINWEKICEQEMMNMNMNGNINVNENVNENINNNVNENEIDNSNDFDMKTVSSLSISSDSTIE